MRELHAPEGLRFRVMIVCLAIALLALTGPFGTFVDLSGPLRLVYWAIAVGGCSIFMYLAMEAAPWFADWPAAPRMALGGMIGALPGAALIGLLEMTLRGSDAFFHDYFWFWFCIACAGFVVTFVQSVILNRSTEGSVAAPVVSKMDAGGRFLARLPLDIGKDIVSLSMQDHYVQVTTSRGSTLILIRFADAMQELADYPGAQIHRSHWVAAGKARRLLREKGRIMVELADGRRLPVSRPHLEQARELVGAAPELTRRIRRNLTGRPAAG